MAESLRRSRHKWMTEFIFEKYWTKPTKRKGVINEDPKNPPKDSMMKLGQVTITIEPHIFDATLYAVKDPKPPAPPSSTVRPVLQYGPPGGSLPPKSAKPSATASKPSPAAKPLSATTNPRSTNNDSTAPSAQGASIVSASSKPHPAHSPSPSITAVSGGPALAPADARPAALAPLPRTSNSPAVAPQQTASTPRYQQSPTPTGFVSGSTPKPAAPPPPPGPANNAVIATLAERATSDDNLRELMKRVAEGKASKAELAQFQRVIDQIHEEHSRKEAQPPPSADKLFVDGRTVKYFAEEVKTILQIVLASNPQQRSSNLRPPAGSDTLIVMLVQAALDDAPLKAAIQRIANGKPEYNDATTLKSTLDNLHKKLMLDKLKKEQKPIPSSPIPTSSSNPISGSRASPAAGAQSQAPQQALRSKGPPPAPKPDISAIVVEFAGGNGDRYLFPKFSILEYRGTQQVVASFLLVRKSSRLEYGGDRELDYYEPITVRLFAASGRHLENLARVVAPREEVVRYMDDVMSNMTRAQYILLAWRLLRERAGEKGEGAEETNGEANGAVSKEAEGQVITASLKPAVLWTAKTQGNKSSSMEKNKFSSAEDEEAEQYQKLIRSAVPGDVEA